VSPFFNRSIVWLEANQTPGCFDQGGSESGVAMFGHAALHPGIAATVFPRTQTGVTTNAPSIAEAMPVADLPIDYHAGESAKAVWLFRVGRGLQLQRQSVDFFFEQEQDRLALGEQLFHPLWDQEMGKGTTLPPLLDRFHPVIDHKTAPLGFQDLARFNQLLALSMDGAQLFFFFAWHAHQRERLSITLNKAVQLQAKRFGIQSISLYPFVALIEFLWADHVATDPESVETPLQSKPKPARLIDGIDFSSLAGEFGGPKKERFLAETLRRLGISSILLFDHHVIILVHINPELDCSSAPIKLEAGSLK
jgi:hypothetical protein